jgi:threonine dehydrogenase-like Zn-dependent dehydrogenase
MSEQFGATCALLAAEDPVATIRAQTRGRGVDVAIEALGIQATFENALRALKPGGVLSSVGVYSGHLRIPLDAFGAGLADQTIVTTLCPGGKERMHRLIRLVKAGRINLKPLFTHRFGLDEISSAYDLFASRRDGVLKVAVAVN